VIVSCITGFLAVNAHVSDTRNTLHVLNQEGRRYTTLQDALYNVEEMLLASQGLPSVRSFAASHRALKEVLAALTRVHTDLESEHPVESDEHVCFWISVACSIIVESSKLRCLVLSGLAALTRQLYHLPSLRRARSSSFAFVRGYDRSISQCSACGIAVEYGGVHTVQSARMVPGEKRTNREAGFAQQSNPAVHKIRSDSRKSRTSIFDGRECHCLLLVLRRLIGHPLHPYFAACDRCCQHSRVASCFYCHSDGNEGQTGEFCIVLPCFRLLWNHVSLVGMFRLTARNSRCIPCLVEFQRALVV
jgi:hypothetical protein